MSDHHVKWTIDEETIQAHFTCTAAVGAFCRMWCAEGCEEHCDPTDGDAHRQTDQGGCGQVPFLGESGESDSARCYAGPETTVRDGPIVLTWEGDDYSWQYEERTHPW